jgi:hypothetical protein
MIINPFRLMKFTIDKNTGMLKLYLPDIIKDNVEAEIDYYDLIIRIK